MLLLLRSPAGSPPPASATPTLVQQNQNSDSSETLNKLTVTLPSVTAGHALVMVTSQYSSGTSPTAPVTAITDSSGNTWVKAADVQETTEIGSGSIWYVASAKASASTLTVTATTSKVAIALLNISEWSMPLTAQSPAATVTDLNGVTPPSITASSPGNSLVIGNIITYYIITPPINAPATQLTAFADGTMMDDGYQVATASTTTLTWNVAKPNAWFGMAVSFTYVPPSAVPVVDAGADASVTVNTAFTRTGTATNSPTSYAWTIVSGPNGVGTTIGTSAALSWTPTVAGTYTLRLSATNSGGTGTDDLVLTATAPVVAPVVDAGVDTSVTVNTAFTRTGTATNTPTSYSWTIVSGPTGAGTTIGTVAALSWTPSVAGTYTLRFSATNSGGTGTDDVIVTASPVLTTATVPYTESFPGNDWSAWSSVWKLGGTPGGSATIQQNAGTITAAATGTYASARMELNTAPLGDMEISGVASMATAGVEQYIFWLLNNSGGGPYETGGNAYAFYLDYVNSSLNLRIYTNNSFVDALQQSVSIPSATTPLNFRFQRVGQVLNGKIWTGTEPSAWTASYPLTGTPFTGAAALNVDNGNSAISRTASFKNVVVSVPVSTPTSTVGYAKVWTGSAFVAKPVKVWNGSAWVIKPVKVWNGTTWVTTGSAASGGGTAQSATLALTGAGSNAIGWNAEGTPIYTLLTSDDAGATKIYSPTAGDLVTYQLADLPGAASTVTSVTVHASCYKLDPVSATVRVVVWINGTAYESSDLIPTSNTSYEDLSYTWTKNPATGTAWTPAAVNAMEIGIKKIDSAGERCSYLAAVVAYA